MDLEKASVNSLKDQIREVQSKEEGTIDDARKSISLMEKRVRMKMDWWLLPMVTLLYLFCFIDRSNIGNARIAGLEKDLNLKGYDYNAMLSIFYISYILFEIPGNALCKYIGPGWFIPLSVIGFGTASIGAAFVHNFGQLAGVRFLLGVFEAAMLPANIYYLSRWYTRDELVFRICFFILSASLAGAFGGLLASGILTLDEVAGVKRWRMIFLIEGIITVILGLIGLVIMTDRPESAKWLTEEEKQLVLDRVKAERVGTTEVVDQFTRKKFLKGFTSPVVIATSFMFFFNNITVSGLAFFLPTIVKTIYPTHSVISQQLHTVPPYALGSVACLTLCYGSWRLKRRNIFITLAAAPAVVGYIIFLSTEKPSVRYAATFLPMLGIFSNGAIPASQTSAAVVSDTARLSAVALYAMLGNIGGLISTWAFLPFDSPGYRIGNGLNLAVQGMILVIGTGLFWWAARDNRKRDAKDIDAELEGKTIQQIQDMDWKHPGYRWKL